VSVGSGHSTDEVDFHGTHCAVTSRDVGVRAGTLADLKLIAEPLGFDDATHLLEDPGGRFHALFERSSLRAVAVLLSHAAGNPAHKPLKRFGPRHGSDFFHEQVGKRVVISRVLRFTPLAEAIDERRTADSSAFLLCLHEAVALQHGHVLSYARRRQPQEPREFLNRPFSMTMQVIEDLSTGRLHCVNSLS